MMHLKETELCLGLPGGGVEADQAAVKLSGKRGFSETIDLKLNLERQNAVDHLIIPKLKTSLTKPPPKAQVVGWPPVRSYRKNVMAVQKSNNNNNNNNIAAAADQEEKTSSPSGGGAAAFVKVSMDGAPYLRKVDLKIYDSYQQLSAALAKMFSSFTMGDYGSQGMIDFMNESKLMDLLNSSEYVPSYEDKDGDWMLIGDVPWEMFVDSCKRLRIMKGSEAIGLAPRAMQKCKNRCC